MKTACYCATRNIYKDLIPAVKSLLINSDVERVYLLIEDDKFPYKLPKECVTINVADQTYFPEDGANYTSWWTWMALMKVALSKILPVDKVLYLDVDTIVIRDISEIWDIDIGFNYFAAVIEPFKCVNGMTYTNTGVVMFNLKQIRDTKKDDDMIARLNDDRFEFPDQDVLNEMCQRGIMKLDPAYNSTTVHCTPTTNHPKIIHYASCRSWRTKKEVLMYKRIPWSAIRD